MDWLFYIAGGFLWLELAYALRHLTVKHGLDNLIYQFYYASWIVLWVWICWKL